MTSHQVSPRWVPGWVPSGPQCPVGPWVPSLRGPTHTGVGPGWVPEVGPETWERHVATALAVAAPEALPDTARDIVAELDFELTPPCDNPPDYVAHPGGVTPPADWYVVDTHRRVHAACDPCWQHYLNWEMVTCQTCGWSGPPMGHVLSVNPVRP